MDCKGEYLNARRDTDKKIAKWGCVCIGRTDLHVLPGDPAVDRTQAEDAAQETFLKAVKYLGNFGFSGKFRAFLYKIAANTCIDMQKNKWNQYTALEDLQKEPSYVEKDFKNVEEELVICSLVKNLELKDQEIVLLRFGQNLKLREIAEIVGLPMRTVQSRLKVSLKVIEKEMKGGNLR